MITIKNVIPVMALALVGISCTDDDSFSLRTDHVLTFSSDSVSMDTVFSRVPTARKSLWVYNRSGDGIRCTNVRLENGNQSGFRVNVDGVYLGQESGFQTSGVELRNKDSLFVNIELTSPMNYKIGPQLLEDNLVFSLESGVQQKINLSAYSWDADIVKNLTIKGDTTIVSERPIVVYGPMTVDSLSRTTIAPGTTLYFHAGASLQVYGTLISEGTADKNIVMRTDRTDRMFSYLPYDMVSGQWGGICFHSSSYGNSMAYTDVHSTFNGILCDSSNVDKVKLLLRNSTVHNCQGYGVRAVNSTVGISNCQLTNTLKDCVSIVGGRAQIVSSTLAQFYPFDSNTGAALSFTNYETDDNLKNKVYPLLQMDCINSIVTGSEDDVVMGTAVDSVEAYTYRFENCILRTDSLANGENIKNIIWENADSVDTDTVYGGEKNFRLVDYATQHFDFHLSGVSKAIGAATADGDFALPTDRDGNRRDDRPDIGCYEYIEPENTEE